MAHFLGSELLQGDQVTLARADKDEMTAMSRWSHDLAFQRNLRRRMVYPSADSDVQGWFDDIIEKEEGYPFAVRRRDDDHLVGFVVMTNLFWQARHGMLILAIDPGQQGRGYGTDAVRVILKYAFLEMNLNRVGLEVMAYNDAARRVYEKVGFVLEGTARAFVYRDGVYYDMHAMGILRAEWEARYGYPPIRYAPAE
ncbi:MAG: GNAT family protein [Chloroflexota bacterium]|nr:GNAT family protein [Chloroflexota bacterium]